MTASSFTCPRCGTVSHRPMDISEGYCGHCHDWTGKPTPGVWVTLSPDEVDEAGS